MRFLSWPADKVWAVGDGGLILHSDDGGRTSQQQKVTVAAQQSRQQPMSSMGSAFNSISLVSAAMAQETQQMRQVATKGAETGTITGSEAHQTRCLGPTLLLLAHRPEQRQTQKAPLQLQ